MQAAEVSQLPQIVPFARFGRRRPVLLAISQASLPKLPSRYSKGRIAVKSEVFDSVMPVSPATLTSTAELRGTPSTKRREVAPETRAANVVTTGPAGRARGQTARPESHARQACRQPSTLTTCRTVVRARQRYHLRDTITLVI